MALFSCPRCGAEISTEAKKCPNCELESPWTVKCEAHKIAYGARANRNQSVSNTSSSSTISGSSTPDNTKTVYVVKEEGQSSGQSCGQSLMSLGCVLTVFITIPFLILLFTGF